MCVFYTREINSIFIFFFILIWYLEPRVTVKLFSVNPLFTVLQLLSQLIYRSAAALRAALDLPSLESPFLVN